MRVVVVGSGRVAEALATALARAGVLEGIAARNSIRTKAIATQVGCEAYGIDQIPAADIYIISVSDRAVAEVAAMIPRGSAIVAHTAGSVDVEQLTATHSAVLYPLASFTQGEEIEMQQIPIFIEGTTTQALDGIRELAEMLSNRVVEANSERRGKLHLAAVFACNFTNAMYTEAQGIMQSEGLDFSMLAPLIAQTCSKAIESNNPLLMQTGPASRGDMATIEAHINRLKDRELKDIYKIISDRIWEISRRI